MNGLDPDEACAYLNHIERFIPVTGIASLSPETWQVIASRAICDIGTEFH